MCIRDRQYPILIDNQSAIALACGPATHYQRTKHIGAKYHFQRQLLLDGVVRYQHQAGHLHPADMLTKDLGKKQHKAHRDVIFGKKPIVIQSVKLPESQKIYMRRHNEELARKVKELKLRQNFQQEERTKPDDEQISSKATKFLSACLALLTT